MQAAVCRFLSLTDIAEFMATRAVLDDAWRAVVCARFACASGANKPRNLAWRGYFRALGERECECGDANARVEFEFADESVERFDPKLQRSISTKLLTYGPGMADSIMSVCDKTRAERYALRYVLNGDYVWLTYGNIRHYDAHRNLGLPEEITCTMEHTFRMCSFCFVVREYRAIPIMFSAPVAAHPITGEFATFSEVSEPGRETPFVLNIAPIRDAILSAIDSSPTNYHVLVDTLGQDRAFTLRLGTSLCHSREVRDYVNERDAKASLVIREIIETHDWISVRMRDGDIIVYRD
jgi:hypothetical protein